MGSCDPTTEVTCCEGREECCEMSSSEEDEWLPLLQTRGTDRPSKDCHFVFLLSIAFLVIFSFSWLVRQEYEYPGLMSWSLCTGTATSWTRGTASSSSSSPS